MWAGGVGMHADEAMKLVVDVHLWVQVECDHQDG